MRSLIKKGDYIVLKFGTECLKKRDTDNIDEDVFLHICDKVSEIYEEGYKPVIVSSGAVFMGRSQRKKRCARLDLNRYPEDLKQQVLAGQGQSALMELFSHYLSNNDLGVAQGLVTHRDLTDEQTRKNLIDVVDVCYEDRTVLVLNENDMISNEELKKRIESSEDISGSKEVSYHFGDNDVLSYLAALDLGAKANIMFNPKGGLFKDIEDPSSIIRSIYEKDFDYAISVVKGRESSGSGRAGPESKVNTCIRCARSGIIAIMAGSSYITDPKISFMDMFDDNIDNKTIFYPVDYPVKKNDIGDRL